MTHPEDYRRLKREIDNHFSTDGEDLFKDGIGTRLLELPFLNAVMFVFCFVLAAALFGTVI